MCGPCGMSEMCKDCTQNPNAEEYGMTKEEQLQKDLELQAETIGYLRERIAELEEKLANADYQLEGRDLEIKELKEQIEKMKCCGNCRFSENDKLNGTFCHREGCFVVASAKCKLWEN